MKYKTSAKWYAFPEHFRTEKSWDEYKKVKSLKKARKRINRTYLALDSKWAKKWR